MQQFGRRQTDRQTVWEAASVPTTPLVLSRGLPWCWVHIVRHVAHSASAGVGPSKVAAPGPAVSRVALS
jgi:hypothetical protein